MGINLLFSSIPNCHIALWISIRKLGSRQYILPLQAVDSTNFTMDRIKEKMNSLRLEADEAVAKVEELQARVKTLEQENLAKEQEITSLQHKNGVFGNRCRQARNFD